MPGGMLLELDPHEKPPEVLRQLFKRLQNASGQVLRDDITIIDFDRGLTEQQTDDIQKTVFFHTSNLACHFEQFLNTDPSQTHGPILDINEGIWTDQPSRYEHRRIPGLFVVPALLSPPVQVTLLSRLLHRDLADRRHKTNVHFHHEIELEDTVTSFFSLAPSIGNLIRPKEPQVHKPMTIGQFLTKKLRWLTIGGQYDWTKKEYPKEDPPEFPVDIARLLNGMFPETQAQAAIVNFYSPGDVLSLHRDVSEDCSKGLISLSLGCDGIFMIALQDGNKDESLEYAIIRLRSGDAVYMSGPSRYAWHGVPQIVSGTCPDWMAPWPAMATRDPKAKDYAHRQYEPWAGWMGSKRVNLNVRQMKD